MKVKFLFVCLILCISLQSCDWARKQLGMPTSADIERMRDQLAQNEEDNNAAGDSTNVENDSNSTSSYVEEDISNEESGGTAQKQVPAVRPAQKPAANPARNEPAQNRNVAANNQRMQANNSIGNKFYLIIGSFKNYKNADNLLKFVKEMGYDPTIISLKNGYEMVALAGFDSYTKARNEIEKINSKEICPYDVWIYDVKMGLHN